MPPIGRRATLGKTTGERGIQVSAETIAHTTGRETGRITLRPGGPEDVEDVAALIERENHRPADREEIARLLAAWPSIVAHEDGGLVGFIYSRGFSPDILELRNMVVASDRRRQGLGRRISDAIEDEVRARGFHAVIGVNCWLHPGSTRERASAARAFWLRMGWRILFATDGSVVMAKWLAAP
jgi:GNAT superfamily N-acetyltransferase